MMLPARLQQQLSAGLQREQALEQRRVQVELDWQQCCEETKTQHYLSSQGLIQDLMQARDQVSHMHAHTHRHL